MVRQYITTAIDYPNAAPHMGHVLEKVLADTVARWFRLRGDEVRFQIGADEHGIKIQQTAAKEGLTPEALVDRNVPLFVELYRRLCISADQYIRTSDRPVDWSNASAPQHYRTVQALWQRLQAAGMLEEREYKGLYCSGCERFVTSKDLVDGLCPDHKKAPEEVIEKNWFYKLSDQSEALRQLLTSGYQGHSYRIVPGFRAPETLTLIEQGLEDVSFSRPVSSLTWGVPVPDQAGQTMYVWCDALTNYISGLGYLTDHAETQWWDDARVTHVIGKDIARFHALIWPGMLLAGGVRPPDQLLIHGFLTSEGQKMSKSLGNVVVPADVIDRYGVEALRFYLSHEIPVGNDGDFSWSRFGELYDAKLRNQLGNLLNRVLVLLNKAGGELSQLSKDEWENEYHAAKGESVQIQWLSYLPAMNEMMVQEGCQITFHLVSYVNQRMNEIAPWTIKDPEAKQKALTLFAEYLRHITLMLLPFMPATAVAMARQLNLPYAEAMGEKSFVITDALRTWGHLGEWRRVGTPQILFVPVETAAKPA